MRDLYDQLVSGGKPVTAQRVSEQRQEAVDLEFNVKENSTKSEPNREDRLDVAVALSARS